MSCFMILVAGRQGGEHSHKNLTCPLFGRGKYSEILQSRVESSRSPPRRQPPHGTGKRMWRCLWDVTYGRAGLHSSQLRAGLRGSPWLPCRPAAANGDGGSLCEGREARRERRALLTFPFPPLFPFLFRYNAGVWFVYLLLFISLFL